jgi:hypothetical protein
MNAWTPPEPDTRRARELDELIRQNPATGGRPKQRTAAGDLQRQNQHGRRIAYLRRGGRHAEADIEAHIYAAREANDERERILASQIERQRL